MLKVWGRRNALNVQKVLWTIGELDLAHEHIDLGGPFGGLDDPVYRALNPHGRIPTIDDHGTVVWESGAIIRYLAARHSAGTLWPEDPAARARADQWMDWAQTALQPDFMALFWGLVRRPAEKQDRAAIDAAQTRLSAHYACLDAHLAARRWLGGDTFTMGDIPAGTSCYRYFEMAITRPSLPNLEAWYGRLTAQPAYRRHVMLPFDDLYGREDF